MPSTCASAVMRASVIAAARCFWPGSEEKASRGNTASDGCPENPRSRAVGVGCWATGVTAGAWSAGLACAVWYFWSSAMPRRMLAEAPTNCAMIRPTNEIQAERTLFRFFRRFCSSSSGVVAAEFNGATIGWG